MGGSYTSGLVVDTLCPPGRWGPSQALVPVLCNRFAPELKQRLLRLFDGRSEGPALDFAEWKGFGSWQDPAGPPSQRTRGGGVFPCRNALFGAFFFVQ